MLFPCEVVSFVEEHLDLLMSELDLQAIHLLNPGTDLISQGSAVCNIVAHGSKDAQMEPAAKPARH